MFKSIKARRAKKAFRKAVEENIASALAELDPSGSYLDPSAPIIELPVDFEAAVVEKAKESLGQGYPLVSCHDIRLVQQELIGYNVLPVDSKATSAPVSEALLAYVRRQPG